MLWCLFIYIVSDLDYPLLQERAFCMEELRPQPIIKKRSRFFIPEEMKVMNSKWPRSSSFLVFVAHGSQVYGTDPDAKKTNFS